MKKSKDKLGMLTAFITLFSTAIIAIVMKVRNFDNSTWLKVVLFSVLVFFILGLIIEKMIRSFIETNQARAAEEAAKLEEQEQDEHVIKDLDIKEVQDNP